MAHAAPQVDRFLALPYHIIIVRGEGDGESQPWIARVEELPGCEVRDETADGAARAIAKAMEEWIVAALEKGVPVPEPRREPSHSGRLLLRIPQDLHAELAQKADVEEVSLNGLITGMLAGAVGWRRDGADHGGGRARPPHAARSEGAPRSRHLPAALIASIVVLTIAALAAIALLIVAWQSGW